MLVNVRSKSDQIDFQSIPRPIVYADHACLLFGSLSAEHVLITNLLFLHFVFAKKQKIWQK